MLWRPPIFLTEYKVRRYKCIYYADNKEAQQKWDPGMARGNGIGDGAMKKGSPVHGGAAIE
jgi:hypothetical protein